MINFIIKNIYTKIENVSPYEAGVIRETCTFSDVRFYKRRANYSDLSNGKAKKVGEFITERKIVYYSYFNEKENIFPTGNLFNILDIFDKNNIKYGFQDLREKPECNSLLGFKKEVTLTPYQEIAFDRMIKFGRGIINHAPNSGKTYLGLYFFNNFPVRTLYIVPNLTLLNQTYNKFVEYFNEECVGVIGDGIWNPKLITIASIQSLWSKVSDSGMIEFLKSVECLIIDEAHHQQVSAKKDDFNTWYKIAMLTNAYYRFGFTGSLDKKGTLPRGLLECSTGKELHVISQEYLIANNYSVKPYVKMIKYSALGDYNTWQDAYKNLIYENTDFNKYVANMAKNFSRLGERVFIPLTRVKSQMELLREYIPEAEFIYSRDSRDDRQKKEENFINGTNNILVSTTHSEGSNLSTMSVFMRVCGNKGNKINIQLTGRSLRKADGKDSVLIIDFLFEGEKFTHRHSVQRLKYYKSENFDVEIVDKEYFL